MEMVYGCIPVLKGIVFSLNIFYCINTYKWFEHVLTTYEVLIKACVYTLIKCLIMLDVFIQHDTLENI